MKIIIGGGGTGGHVFPAIAIGQAIKSICPDAQILFVGALGKIEMEKVPQAGFEIVGLPIAGFHRKFTLRNLSFPFKLANCMLKSRKIIKDFKPDFAIGVGGYASGPILRAAAKQGVKIFIQEQNSHAGVTNKILQEYASKIFTAYPDMTKYFPKEKTEFLGNPVRNDIVKNDITKEQAQEFFGLGKNKFTILSIGGSLGASTINKSILANLDKFKELGNVQIIWQTGKIYIDEINNQLKGKDYPFLHHSAFVTRMDMAYKAADLVISRSGALSVSELCIAGKPTIFIPSPNVAEDHQTKNAMALVNENAADIIADKDAQNLLFEKVSSYVNNKEKLEELSSNILKLAKPNSAFDIANYILDYCK